MQPKNERSKLVFLGKTFGANKSPYRVETQMRFPRISAIVISWDGYRGGNVPELLNQLKKQSLEDIEILLVQGFSPCSRAHNEGAQRAEGEILVFLDDDVSLGHTRVLENMVKIIIENPRVGLVGASQLLPPISNWFQRRCSKQLYRSEFPIVNEMVESDMATHACMAVSKQIYVTVGGEDVNLMKTDDTDFRYKIRSTGYKIVIAPDTWVYHPMPLQLRDLIEKKVDQGIGQAHDFKYLPDKIYKAPPSNTGTFAMKSRLLSQSLRFMRRFLGSVICFKFIRVVAMMSFIMGFTQGVLRTKSWFLKKYSHLEGQVHYMKRFKNS